MDASTVKKGKQVDEIMPEKRLRTITPVISRRGVDVQLFKDRETGDIILKESKYYHTIKE